ncbi:calcium uniporter regulatory subunit MCUb, mitochondrial-like [Scleropages formosus]|uniref:Calcium uniporter protein n=1 Tax=Scleropages formosus TaxID=113540 RepID=A0A0P7Z174_SCLFO|nr:calcium uniporter regulatory subunit MCUb, mitochondrial-like [Scleropages formosus]
MGSLLRLGKLQAPLFRCFLQCYKVSDPGSTTAKEIFSKILSKRHLWAPGRVVYYSTLSPSNDLSVEYKHGRPVLAVPLPSRNERCLFFLRPMLMDVTDFLRDIQKEDPGIHRAVVLTAGGDQVSGTTSIDSLLKGDFHLLINDITFSVHSPTPEKSSSERAADIQDMKTLVHMLYAAMHLPPHQLRKEKELLQRLDFLRQELTPLEKAKDEVVQRAELKTTRVLWTGLALMSVQTGALAWLTWWVYSWDIMEPVTYFLTYSTSIGIFAYYILTKQDYVYPDVKDRQFLHYFYKGAKKQRFNIQKYNRLKEELSMVEEDLRRLRSPVKLGLPVEQVQANP